MFLVTLAIVRFPARFFCLLALAAGAACGAVPPKDSASSAGLSPVSDVKGDWFTDRAEESGLKFTHVNGMSGKFYYAEIIAPGAAMFDYDNDGDLDLLLCNGHPDDKVEERLRNVTYREPALLFRNTGRGFENVGQQSGAFFSRPLAGRGLALGDFDNDGSVDVLITQNNDAPVLLRNNVGRQNHWLGVRLLGRKANIDAIGAKLSYQAGAWQRHQYKVGGGSYLSSHDPRMVLGLGQRTKMDWLEVTWPEPSGKTERFTALPIDRYITIVEGEGKWK